MQRRACTEDQRQSPYVARLSNIAAGSDGRVVLNMLLSCHEALPTQVWQCRAITVSQGGSGCPGDAQAPTVSAGQPDQTVAIPNTLRLFNGKVNGSRVADSSGHYDRPGVW